MLQSTLESAIELTDVIMPRESDGVSSSSDDVIEVDRPPGETVRSTGSRGPGSPRDPKVRGVREVESEKSGSRVRGSEESESEESGTPYVKIGRLPWKPTRRNTTEAALRTLHEALRGLADDLDPHLAAYTMAVSIALAIERILDPTVKKFRRTYALSRKLSIGRGDDRAMARVARVLQDHEAGLTDAWGYRDMMEGEPHTNYEKEMTADNTLYGCLYSTTDVVMRNLRKAVTGEPLIPSDSVIKDTTVPTDDKNKWSTADNYADWEAKCERAVSIYCVASSQQLSRLLAIRAQRPS